MGIDLFFSNQLEHLAEKLANNMHEGDHLPIDPFRSLQIIVPNINLAKWLTLFLSRREAIVMNTDFQFLEIGLWEMIAAMDPQSSSVIWRDHLKTRLLVLHSLMRIDPSDPDLAPLTRYLFRTNRQTRPDYSVRIWQVAEKLATLFQEYEYHRSDMIRHWKTQAVEKETVARFEQRVYNHMLATRDNLVLRSNQSVFSLMEYADHVLPINDSRHANKKGLSRIHLFGLSQVSAFHLSLIERLAPHYEICIYALNPSREFWEDMRTPAENRWIKHQNKNLTLQEYEQESGELPEEDHPLLSAWGKPGRESVRLLCHLTDYTFHAGFARPEEKVESVLAGIQNDILTLGKDSGQKHTSQDRSLQIYGCPGIQREVETVFQSILFNLSENNELQQTEIAILVPQMTAYKPVFDQVFNKNPKRLTYSLVDSRADIESIYAKAIMGLLEISTGTFTRRTVFDLILNPCFRHRWRLQKDEVRIWAKWAEALNIFHTYETDTPSGNNAPSSGRYTFKQGLQRLRMARIFTQVGDKNFEALHYNNLIPFADTYTGDTDLLEKFCLVIEALDHAVTALRLGHVTASRWKTVLLTVANDLFAIPPDYRGESTVRQGMFQILEALSFFDELSEDDTRPQMDAALISEYLRSGLRAISGRSGDYLTEGVTISELTPMRPIPFKIIYVLGMEEGGFPGREERSSLDLRRVKRRIGDISLPERNRYLFLETLLAAREKLYISYISKDLQKDRVLSPGQVVFQLIDFVEKNILAGDQPFRMATVPLKSSSTRYLHPDAVTTWSDICTNDQLIDRVVSLRNSGMWPDIQSRLGTYDLSRLSRLDPDLSRNMNRKSEVILPKVDRVKPVTRNSNVNSKPESNQDSNLDSRPDDSPDHPLDPRPDSQADIQLDRLVRFLQNPLEEYARFHLGIFKDESNLDQLIENEDEPFVSQFPVNWRLIMQPLYQWLDLIFEGVAKVSDHKTIGLEFDRYYATCSRQSTTPQGHYAERECLFFRRTLINMANTLNPLLKQAIAADTLLAGATIGQPYDPTGPPSSTKSLNSGATRLLVFGNKNKHSDLEHIAIFHGHLRWLWRDEKSGWHVLIPVSNKALSKKPSKHLIKPILFYLMCRANPDSQIGSDNNPIFLHLANAQAIRTFTIFINPDEAIEYLRYLLSVSQDQENNLWLPFDVIIDKLAPLWNTASKDITNDQRRRFSDEMKKAFRKKASELEKLINPPFPDDLIDQAQSRFQFLSYLQIMDKRYSPPIPQP